MNESLVSLKPRRFELPHGLAQLTFEILTKCAVSSIVEGSADLSPAKQLHNGKEVDAMNHRKGMP